jgi:glycerate kinase
MKSRFVVAFDSFKDCMSSSEANRVALEAIMRINKNASVHSVPISDGGEGLLDALFSAVGGCMHECKSHDALMHPHCSRYLMTADGNTAYVELAEASGLSLLPMELRNPLFTSTYGTGETMYAAIEKGCRQIVIGLGGSATNDGGTGCLSALGFRFLDASGTELFPCGNSLSKIATIDDTHVKNMVRDCQFTLLCDVNNSLYGPSGAAVVYGPQKGADEMSVALLDEGLKHYAAILKETTGKDISQVQGAGAAGGVGAGLMALLSCKTVHGIDFMLDVCGFDLLVQNADFVLTGEGRSDASTLMGKTAYGIMRRAKRQGIPTILLSGQVSEQTLLLASGFYDARSITPPTCTLENALQLQTAKKNLSEAVKRLLIDLGR